MEARPGARSGLSCWPAALVLCPDADVATGGKYVSALASDLPSRNGWSVAEHAGTGRPASRQRLLNRACWDEAAAMSQVSGTRRPGWMRRPAGRGAGG